MIDSYRFFYESSRSLAGFPKAYLFSYSAANWETSHCKYMSQKTIAFWAMHTLSTFLRIRTDLSMQIFWTSVTVSLSDTFLTFYTIPFFTVPSALLLYLLFRAVKKFLSIKLIMNSVRQWNSHQRHKFLRAHASRDISRIHISGRQVVRDDHNVIQMGMITQKLVRWTTKFWKFLFNYLASKAYLRLAFYQTQTALTWKQTRLLCGFIKF